jgi:tetratricopeptide (TPR) repeat protein
MGVVTGTGVMKKVARGAAIGVLAVAMAACGSSSKGGSGPVTISQALADYYAGNTSKATSEFRDIVKADPTNKFGWYNLGVIAQYAGNSKEAASDYLKVLAIDPKFEGALYNLGLVRYSGGNAKESIKLLRRAVAVTPGDANAHWNLGLAMASIANTKAQNDAATKELNKALKINPGLLKGVAKPQVPTGGTSTTVAGGTVTTAGGAAPTTTVAGP